MTRACTLAAWRQRVVGATQAEAAAKTGLSQRDVSRLESKPATATVGALHAYAEALGGTLEVHVVLGEERRRLVL